MCLEPTQWVLLAGSAGLLVGFYKLFELGGMHGPQEIVDLWYQKACAIVNLMMRAFFPFQYKRYGTRLAGWLTSNEKRAGSYKALLEAHPSLTRVGSPTPPLVKMRTKRGIVSKQMRNADTLRIFVCLYVFAFCMRCHLGCPFSTTST